MRYFDLYIKTYIERRFKQFTGGILVNCFCISNVGNFGRSIIGLVCINLFCMVITALLIFDAAIHCVASEY